MQWTTSTTVVASAEMDSAGNMHCGSYADGIRFKLRGLFKVGYIHCCERSKVIPRIPNSTSTLRHLCFKFYVIGGISPSDTNPDFSIEKLNTNYSLPEPGNEPRTSCSCRGCGNRSNEIPHLWHWANLRSIQGC